MESRPARLLLRRGQALGLADDLPHSAGPGVLDAGGALEVLVPAQKYRQALAPAGLQSSSENTRPSWLASWTGGAVPGVRSQMRAAARSRRV